MSALRNRGKQVVMTSFDSGLLSKPRAPSRTSTRDYLFQHARLPEALLLIDRVALRYRSLLRDRLPVAERVSLATLVWLWRRQGQARAAWGAGFDAFPEQGWDKVFDVNVKAPFFLTQALHGALKRAARPERPAKVVNIGSIDGLRVNAWETYSYQASKAAILHLTRKMAARLIRDGIVVSAIAPGAFPSEMNRAARDRADDYVAVIPAGRIGRPQDMAAAAVYLASGAGDYVVGEVLTVDGGVTFANLDRLVEP